MEFFLCLTLLVLQLVLTEMQDKQTCLIINERSRLYFSNANGLTQLEIRVFKRDVWNFNCVNFSKLIHIGDREYDDPYIEASQANMLY